VKSSAIGVTKLDILQEIALKSEKKEKIDVEAEDVETEAVGEAVAAIVEVEVVVESQDVTLGNGSMVVEEGSSVTSATGTGTSPESAKRRRIVATDVTEQDTLLGTVLKMVTSLPATTVTKSAIS